MSRRAASPYSHHELERAEDADAQPEIMRGLVVCITTSADDARGPVAVLDAATSGATPLIMSPRDPDHRGHRG